MPSVPVRRSRSSLLTSSLLTCSFACARALAIFLDHERGNQIAVVPINKVDRNLVCAPGSSRARARAKRGETRKTGIQAKEGPVSADLPLYLLRRAALSQLSLPHPAFSSRLENGVSPDRLDLLRQRLLSLLIHRSHLPALNIASDKHGYQLSKKAQHYTESSHSVETRVRYISVRILTKN